MEVEKRYEIEIKAFGKRLKELRKKKGLIQLDLEIKCGLDRTDVSRIENGLKNIEFYTIVKIANALEVPLFDLFYYKGGDFEIQKAQQITFREGKNMKTKPQK